MKNNENNVEKITHPFFSIVIPVYNKEPHIARSIKSVLNQSYNNFELIIVCDPSTDNSNLEVEQFLDSRIRVFYRNEPGPGGYAARNLGIKNAKAEWIAFLDADDEWLPDYLTNIYNLSAQFPDCSFLGSSWIIVDPERADKIQIDKYSQTYNYKNNHIISFKEYLDSEVYLNRPFYTSTVVAKRSLLIDSGLFPEGRAMRGGDVDTWLRCISNASYLAVGSFTGAYYYRDSVNMVSKSAFDDASALRRSVKAILLKNKDKPTAVLLKKFSNLYTHRAWTHNLTLQNTNNNFRLIDNLYYDVDSARNMSIAMLSLLPKKINMNIRKLKNLYFSPN